MLWHKGRIVDEESLALSASDRGLTLGDGLFETLPAFNGKAFLAGPHLERMKASAARLRLAFDEHEAGCALTELAKAHQDPCVIRLSVSRGVGARGLALPEPQGRPVTNYRLSTCIETGWMRLSTAASRLRSPIQ